MYYFLKQFFNILIKLYILNPTPETLCRAIKLHDLTAYSFIKGQFSSEVSRTKYISSTCRLQEAIRLW